MTLTDEAKAGGVGNPRASVFGCARMTGLLGWSQNTSPSFHQLARGFGNDHLRWPRLSPQSSFEFPPFAPPSPFAMGAELAHVIVPVRDSDQGHRQACPLRRPIYPFPWR